MLFINKIFSLPKAIIYDWHGTLFKLNAKLFLDSMNKAFEVFGKALMVSLSEQNKNN